MMSPPTSKYLRKACVSINDPDPVARLAQQLGRDNAFVAMFASPNADFTAIMRHASILFSRAEVVGCTTAGEVFGGYVEDQIVAIALPFSDFAVSMVEVSDLANLDGKQVVKDMIVARRDLAAAHPEFTSEFAFLIVDGTSFHEDELMNVLAHGLGPVPLFGGSAGDGARFEKSLVARGAKVRQQGAYLTFVRTRCPIKVFSLDHLDVTQERMVVTKADPSRRQVQEINGAPAAIEYARLLKKDPGQLGPFTFAAHPLVVRAGGRYHVRSIQRVANGTDLVFFSAIDEGVVLTLATPQHLAQTLDARLSELTEGQGMLDGILACDCILRRIESQQKQLNHVMADVLQRHRVTGFSTYGEQFGALHVNMTMTGIAIFEPEDGVDG